MATGKSLVFANACPKELSIWIVYEGANGWTSHNQAYWTVPGNDRITMADRDIPLSPVSDELYYFAKTTDGSTEWSGDSSFEGLANLRRAVVTTDANNNYLLELTCRGGEGTALAPSQKAASRPIRAVPPQPSPPADH